MKALFLYFPENVRQGKPNHVNGWRFVATLENNADAFEYLMQLEDIFPADEKPMQNRIYDGNGREVYDPNYPDRWLFGDYTYFIETIRELDEFIHAHKIKAILNADPWNIDRIKAELGIMSEPCAYAIELINQGLERHEVNLKTLDQFPDLSLRELTDEISNFVMWI